MLIGGEFPRSSQFKKFLNVVLHRNAVGKSHWWKIGSFAPPGGGNALTFRRSETDLLPTLVVTNFAGTGTYPTSVVPSFAGTEALPTSVVH